MDADRALVDELRNLRVDVDREKDRLPINGGTLAVLGRCGRLLERAVVMIEDFGRARYAAARAPAAESAVTARALVERIAAIHMKTGSGPCDYAETLRELIEEARRAVAPRAPVEPTRDSIRAWWRGRAHYGLIDREVDQILAAFAHFCVPVIAPAEPDPLRHPAVREFLVEFARWRDGHSRGEMHAAYERIPDDLRAAIVAGKECP